MTRELLTAKAGALLHDEDRFGCSAREAAIRLLAWTQYQPDHALVETLVNDLTIQQRQGHWGTTQGDAWTLLALTDYARKIDGTPRPTEGRLLWNGQSIAFHLNGGTSAFTHSFAFTNSEATPLTLVNATTNRLFASALLEVRPPVAQQPRQDLGFSLQRRYDRLDEENQPQDMKGLRVGDRVLVTLRLTVREPARFVAIDDALPSIFEAINPEFKTQRARGGLRPLEMAAEDGGYWMADFRELRKERSLSFANWVTPGNYTLRYLARVRAAGTVTAPCAKVEEMYHPERYGLSETQTVTSEPLE
jgi:uncharacterized protein YfaS (alpha-2-macroglobulin family)